MCKQFFLNGRERLVGIGGLLARIRSTLKTTTANNNGRSRTDDGSYALKHKGEAGVPVGAFKIAVTAYVKEMTDKEMSEFLSASGKEQKRIEAKRNEKMTLVPENYHNTRTSGLSYEVVEGKQTHDIDIVVPES